MSISESQAFIQNFKNMPNEIQLHAFASLPVYLRNHLCSIGYEFCKSKYNAMWKVVAYNKYLPYDMNLDDFINYVQSLFLKYGYIIIQINGIRIMNILRKYINIQM